MDGKAVIGLGIAALLGYFIYKYSQKEEYEIGPVKPPEELKPLEYQIGPGQ